MGDLERWAADLWRGLAALVDHHGLPGDSIGFDLDAATVRRHTSPSNIGLVLAATLAAREVGLVDADEARARCGRVLDSLAVMPRHEPSGMFYNWYESADARLGVPVGHRGSAPFVSSVDNGWLAFGLLLVSHAVPALRGPAQQLLRPMDWRVFWDAGVKLMRGGFWERPRRAVAVAGDPLDSGRPLHLTRHHYDLLGSETRIVSYMGILEGHVSADAYLRLRAPVRTYRGRRVFATLGGSTFEALSPSLFVPEAAWSPGFWGEDLAATTASHRDGGLYELDYGVWGFAPCSVPGGRGYREFGMPQLSLYGDGYGTTWRGQGVVAPYASLLGLSFDPESVTANLQRLERDVGCYGPGGFLDSVGVRTRLTSRRYLALDQSLGLVALANHLREGVIWRLFCAEGIGEVLEPVVRSRRWPAERREDRTAAPGRAE